MRFCMVTTFFPPFSFGGDGIFVERLSDALARRGHDVDVVHCADSFFALGGRPQATRRRHARVTAYPLRSGAGMAAPLLAHQTGRPLLHARRLRDVMRRRPHDVVHFHNISLFGPGVLSYGAGVKLFTLHEHWLLCQQHTLFRMDRELCTERTCVRCAAVYRRPPQWWRWTPLLARRLAAVDCLIAPSEASLDLHAASGVTAPMVHVPHFVPEPPPAAPSDAAALPSQPFFLFAGRLERLKGLQTVIPLFRARRDLHLLVAGEGRFEPELRRLADGLANVQFAGQLSGGALTAAYARAVALVVPSLTYEPFALVLAEAMAAGTPVIARRLGAIAEVASKGGGLTYATDDELIEAMDRLAADTALRAERARVARAAYERHWSEEVHVRRYLDLIADLQSRRSGSVSPAPGGDA